MSQIQKIAHPRSRAMVSIVNGVYGIVKHQGEDMFKLGGAYGTMISRKSALKVIEKYTEGQNKVMYKFF